jgi:hypothetical protein
MEIWEDVNFSLTDSQSASTVLIQGAGGFEPPSFGLGVEIRTV